MFRGRLTPEANRLRSDLKVERKRAKNSGGFRDSIRGDTNPEVVDVAKVPFAARSLTFDGENFWSNHRAANETVCFSIAELDGSASLGSGD